jgi:nucleoside-diphosphate-sugar epimerase
VKILLLGGAGGVGTAITPYLTPEHELRVLDVRPPSHPDVEYVAGSVTDPEAVATALDGVDTFVYLVMQGRQGGRKKDQTVEQIVDNYSVNNLGLHLLLYLAQERGITRGVYTSSMSVHYRERRWYPSEELTPYDTPSVYGLTKGFGELICQYFAQWFDMNLIALRITGPRPRDEYLAERRNPTEYPGGFHLYVTDEEDLANAYRGALEAVQTGHGRFDAVFVAGDEEEREHNLSKARRVLGWEPTSHKLV